MKKGTLIVAMLFLLAVPRSGHGNMLVYDAINYLQSLTAYLKEVEECMSIVNTEWATLEEYRRNIEQVKRKISEYERMMKAGQKVVDLIEEEKWKQAAKRTRRLYDWGMNEFFDQRPGAPVDIEELLKEHFYMPRDPDDVITDTENLDIESDRMEREISFNYEELEALKRRLLYAAGTQSESDRRREEVFPKMKEMLDEADGESPEALLKAMAQQNMILMQQLQDLIDQQTQAAVNEDNERARKASESAEFIDYETNRLDDRQPRTFKWDGDRLGEM